ncbi:MAG: thioredoxin-dependent thiol peroxidase [Bacteroidales bacterium]|nr:MAG: thioredoxin-dependent thiol peroxidase [Bacteroidales bacterium]
MTHLKVGDPAPVFSAKDHNGNPVHLGSLKGQKVILFFYPKDNTPGCTAEACSLRDNYTELINRGFTLIGISPDSEKSHRNFSSKFSLPFPLIPDQEKKILQDYGVWGEKKMYGKSYMGVLRTTFIIGEKGKIERIIEKVRTGDHAQQILEESSG